MKKINKILIIISVVIVILGVFIGIGTSNELLNSISGENNAIELFGVFGAKIIGTIIIIGSVIIDLLIWLFYGLILLIIRMIKKFKKNN